MNDLNPTIKIFLKDTFYQNFKLHKTDLIW